MLLSAYLPLQPEFGDPSGITIPDAMRQPIQGLYLLLPS